MKRRLALLGISLLAILAAFVAYGLVAGSSLLRAPGDGTARQTDRRARTQPQSAEDAPLVFLVRDDDGYLEGIYHFPDWERLEDGSYQVSSPRIQLFRREGQRVTIEADRGTIEAEEIARGLNPRRGRLEGNVQIVFDRRDATDADVDSDDQVRIRVDDLTFDNETLEIRTDSYVTLWSREADVLGRGLLIRWNETPQELRLLKIFAGELMTIRQPLGEGEFLAMSGGESSTRPAATAPDGAGNDLTPGDRLGKVQTRYDLLPSRGASAVQGSIAPGDRAGTDLREVSQTRPEERPRQNVYRAIFHGQVRVDSGPRYLEGANRLAIAFEWGREQEEQLLGPSTRPATQPAGEQSQPETVPAEGSQSAPIVITWTGELVLEPIAYVEEPSVERVELAAEGERLTLADENIKSRCGRLLYVHEPGDGGAGRRAGRMIRGGQQPVLVTTADGQRLEAREVTFDAARSVAELTGPGRISQADETADQPGQRRNIAWKDFLLARFARDTETDEATIRQALLQGEVRLHDPNGDSLQSNRLHVWFAEGSAGPYPERAIATGDVSAMQEGSRITAREVTLYFEPDPNAEADDIAAFKPTRMLATGDVSIEEVEDGEPTVAEADWVEARLQEGTAVLKAVAPGRQPLATTSGEPRRAVVRQGRNRIQAGELRLRRIQRNSRGETFIHVTAPTRGRLAFSTQQDFVGNTLDEPRLVSVTWKRRMEYRDGGLGGDPNDAVARFDIEDGGPVEGGGVLLTTGSDTIAGGGMVVAFDRAGAETLAAEDANEPQATGDTDRGIGLDLGGFDRRTLASATVLEDVAVRGSERNARGEIVQRLLLLGDLLAYDARDGVIDCDSPGKLLVEDYRTPEPGRTTALSGAGIDQQRPWQTAFAWKWPRKETNSNAQPSQAKPRLHLDLRQRRVTLTGDVSMIHRSGDKIIPPQDPNVRQPEQVAGGRLTTLVCREMIAEFAEAQQGAADSDAVVGPLLKFTAIGDVDIKDGPYRLLGERMQYMRDDDMAVVWGYQLGEPRSNAQAQQISPAGRTVRRIQFPELHCVLDGGHIKEVLVPGASAVGGR